MHTWDCIRYNDFLSIEVQRETDEISERETGTTRSSISVRCRSIDLTFKIFRRCAFVSHAKRKKICDRSSARSFRVNWSSFLLNRCVGNSIELATKLLCRPTKKNVSRRLFAFCCRPTTLINLWKQTHQLIPNALFYGSAIKYICTSTPTHIRQLKRKKRICYFLRTRKD